MISIIVPVHNEASILKKNVSRLLEAAKALGDFQLILAEDGSTDGSREAASALASGRVILISSEKRLGRGTSLKRAIAASSGDTVIYMDADLATDLSHLKELVTRIGEGYDIVTGSRLMKGSKVTGRRALREFFSRGYNLLLRLLFMTRINDHQCGFKAFRKSSVLPLLDEVEDTHWFWDSELLIRAQKKGLKVAEIPVRWTDRKDSSVRLRLDILRMGAAAIRLRLKI
jgi:glycosyltransferase involved in cell wall biosynthesis